MLGDLTAAMKRLTSGAIFGGIPAFSVPVSGAVLGMIEEQTISKGASLVVLEAIGLRAQSDLAVDPDVVRAIVDEKGLRQVSNTTEIDAVVEKIIAANQDKVAEFKSGKDKLFGFFVGQVMKAMAGKANPAMVNETLKRRLT
jgi:aspartyl-tRNA(Asn)/glutamyl-tRNA(Gln) amidotransferase subunit B